MSNIAEIEQGIIAIRELCSLPIIAQVTIGVDGRTTFGDTPFHIARRLDATEAEVIGLNCSVGPDVMLDAIEEMASVTSKRISVQPNAGLPREVQGRQMYMASPDYFGKYAKRLIHKGVKYIGGCCGTTPEHVKAIADSVRPLSPRRHIVVVDAARMEAASAGLEPVPLSERSAWGRKIAAGEFVATVEIVRRQRVRTRRSCSRRYATSRPRASTP